MNDIDRYLDQACEHVGGPDSLRQHLRKELREHLEEEIDALVAEGMSQGEATTKAIESLGEPEEIRDEMQAVYGPSVTSLLVNEAVKWKDGIWHLVAQCGLALITALTTCFMLYLLVRKVPQVYAIHAELDKPIPASLANVAAFSGFVIRQWYLFFLAAAVGIGLFEWRWLARTNGSFAR